MIYNTTRKALELISAFEDTTLDRDDWDHRAHLVVGLYYCLEFPFAMAINKMREGVKRLNNAHGVPNSETSGYHETLTVFWMTVIKQFIEGRSRSTGLGHMAGELVGLCSNPRLPLEFYSRPLLFSPEARRHHVQPDLEPLKAGTGSELRFLVAT